MTPAIAPAPPDGVLRVTERRADHALRLYTHAHWTADDAWLVHGITGRADDMSLFGAAPAGAVVPRWMTLRATLGCSVIIHARQVHRGDVLIHAALPEGIFIARDADGHATSRTGTLLAVSVADCVPIFIAAPDVRAVALLHAGWRGIAAGIVENGVEALTRTFGASAAQLRLHCGPAICGKCYEVGDEVPAALGLDARATHVDLRAAIAHRALATGVPAALTSISTHCTRCSGSEFFSHRAGCAERQIAVLGIRA